MPVVVFKQISPKLFNVSNIRRGIEQAARNYVRREILRDFKRTVRTWTVEPEFIVEMESTNNVIMGTVYTNDLVWKWVSRGTEPHPIEPVNADALRYQVGYTDKTTPGEVDSGPGGHFGEFTIRSRVEHPGIAEPRDWERIIQNDHIGKFQRYMDDAISDIMRATGHTL